MENIYKIHQKRRVFLESDKEAIKQDFKETKNKIEILDNKINKYIEDLEYGQKIDVLSGTRENFEKQILCYYVGLIGEEDSVNVDYSAESPIDEKIIPIFKEIIIDADRILKKYYKDARLEILLSKDSYQIKDILSVNKLIQRSDYYDKSKENDIKKKIGDIKAEKENLISIPANSSLLKNMENLNKAIESNINFVYYAEKYFEHKKSIEDFKEKYGDMSKQWMISFFKYKLLDKEGLDTKSRHNTTWGLIVAGRDFDADREEVVSNLESMLKIEGSEPSIESFGNPAKLKFPWWLGNILIGIGLPVIRNMILKGYIKKDADGEEYAGTFFAGLFNGIMGGVLIDGLHPLVMPARMLSPLLLQPIFKVLHIDPCKDISNEVL
ncbi:MAG: hypothetical protein L6408_03815 [Nanoarchaeota archaeon]|nr:hypothetical protein [Nanoarchaeota archaeon]